MKGYRYIICILIVVLVLLQPGSACAQALKPHTAKGTVRTEAMYVFRPQIVYPLNSSARQLSAGFELRFSRDSIFCYLPYFGNAYNAVYGSSDHLLNFSTADLGYKEQQDKKGVRIIVLKPHNRKEIREMNITLYPAGEAYVWISFSQRQHIAYYGPVVTE
jgi:hypothetical protein